MTSPVKDTVQVSIVNETPRLTQVGFGVPAIFMKNPRVNFRTKFYSEASEMLADGFESSDPAYKKALVLMGQARVAKQFLVGKRNPAANTKQIIELSANPTGGTFIIEVEGETTAAIPYDANATAIKAALEALSNVDMVIVLRESSTRIEIEFAGSQAESIVELVEFLSSLTPTITAEVSYAQYGSEGETVSAAYEAIKQSNNDFFNPIMTNDFATDDEVVELAALIETEKRVLTVLRTGTTLADTNYASDPTDLATRLKKLNYNNTYVIYADSLDNYIDAAAVGLQITKTPGSSAYMYKTFVGVTPCEITTTQRANLRSKNCNFYEVQSGKPVFKDGKVPSGEWIDIMIGIHYLSVRMGETVFAGISTPEKVDFDENGINLVESFMNTALYNYGVENNLINENSILITMPNPRDIPAADKANRVLKNCKFKATLKGAIHFVNIEGTLST